MRRSAGSLSSRGRHLRVCFGLFFWLSSSCAAPKQAGMEHTLQRYIASIEQNQPATAYSLLDESVRRQITEEEFIAKWKTLQPELKAQASQLRTVLTHKTKMQAKADVIFPSGARAKLGHYSNSWQIEEEIFGPQQAKAPVEVLRAFLNALEQRNYKNLMQLLAKSLRESIEREIAERQTRLKRALQHEIDIRGNHARLDFGSGYKLELIKEEGQWRILQLN